MGELEIVNLSVEEIFLSSAKQNSASSRMGISFLKVGIKQTAHGFPFSFGLQ